MIASLFFECARPLVTARDTTVPMDGIGGKSERD